MSKNNNSSDSTNSRGDETNSIDESSDFHSTFSATDSDSVSEMSQSPINHSNQV